MKRWRVASSAAVQLRACRRRRRHATLAAARARARRGDAQARVAGGRARDQVVEHRVVEAAPPIGGDGRDRGAAGSAPSVAGAASVALAVDAARCWRSRRARGRSIDAKRDDDASSSSAPRRPSARGHRLRGSSSQRVHSPLPRLGRLAVGSTMRLSMSFNCDHSVFVKPARCSFSTCASTIGTSCGRDLAFGRELDADDAAVVGRALAPAEALGLEAVEQARHRAGIALQSRARARRPSTRDGAQHEERPPTARG